MILKFERHTEVLGDAKFYKAELKVYAGWKLILYREITAVHRLVTAVSSMLTFIYFMKVYIYIVIKFIKAAAEVYAGW